MAEQPSFQHRVPKTVINVLTLEPGTRVRLVGDAIAEIVANPQDGVWLFLRGGGASCRSRPPDARLASARSLP